MRGTANGAGLSFHPVVRQLLTDWADRLAVLSSHLQGQIPDSWEGDLPTDHPNRCDLRDNLLYKDIFNDDGSHRAAWRCHKRAGHDGPCSSHNDCGVMSRRVVCGKLPGHTGLHAWATEIPIPSTAVSATTADQGSKEVLSEQLQGLRDEFYAALIIMRNYYAQAISRAAVEEVLDSGWKLIKQTDKVLKGEK